MGNSFNKPEMDLGQIYHYFVGRDDFEKLEDRLRALESIDRNGDGIISKEEYNRWREGEMENFRTQLFKDTANHKQEIYNLNKQLESLKAYNKQLQELIEDKNQIIHDLSVKSLEEAGSPAEVLQKKVDLVSEIQIEQFVDQLLRNKAVNSSYIPDFVERRIYKNIISMVMGIANNVLKETSFELMGHRVTLDMKPKDFVED